jgi:sugar-specific transcriptional regulator TrmB
MAFNIEEELSKLGLSAYQARVYFALASSGPSSVTEIHETSKVPRTKIYEVLEQLANKGAVEIQTGRPMIYKATSPKILIEQLKTQYLESANHMTKFFEERLNVSDKRTNNDLVWVVRGKASVKSKLSEIIVEGKKNVLILESYPPRFLQSLGKVITQLRDKGVSVRAVCLLRKDQIFRNPKTEFIECRRIVAESHRHERIEELLKQMRIAVSKGYVLAVIDDSLSFVCFPNVQNNADTDLSVMGISIGIPGVPMMQKIMFEQFIDKETTRTVF